MAVTFHITKRKLNKAVKLAIADGKISAQPFELFEWHGDVLLFWRSRKVSAVVRSRQDLTICIGYEASHENEIGMISFSPK